MKQCYFYACNFTKSNTPPWVFLRFLNYTNDSKLRKASHILTLLRREKCRVCYPIPYQNYINFERHKATAYNFTTLIKVL